MEDISTSLPKTIEVLGETYTFIRGRRNMGGIYRSPNGERFARYGSREQVLQEFRLHQTAELYGFPIASIVATPTDTNPTFFVEASLGNALFTDLFRDHLNAQGMVANEQFQALLTLIQQFTEAQTKTRQSGDWNQVFAKCHIHLILEELPNEADRIRKAWEKTQVALASVPFVLTHGDFNPHNLFPAGVIDFEDQFYGPEGYDPVTVIAHTLQFPRSGDYEMIRHYSFSLQQAQRLFDTVQTTSGYDVVSRFAPLLFLRSCWSSAGMHEKPNIQKWRYERFRQLLDLYLANELTPKRWWQLDAE